jgi:hypothetical protein
MIVSDAPNCGITYDRHYDDRNSFIIQATVRSTLSLKFGYNLRQFKIIKSFIFVILVLAQIISL